MADPAPDETSLTDANSVLVCPQCRASVSKDDTECPHCGIDLVLAAAMVERQMLSGAWVAAQRPATTEIILPRFGAFLVQNGYITDEQLHTALERQKELSAQGDPRTIGQILLDMHSVTREQLDQASFQQVQHLQHALRSIYQQLEQSTAQAREAMEQALERMNELNQLKLNFISTITHELRTPLTHIKGYNDMLTLGMLGPVTEEQRRAFTVIAQATERLDRLSNDLIRFASGAKGQLAIFPTPISPNNLLTRVVDVSKTKAAAAQVQLRMEAPQPLPLVMADGEKMYWVLYQLCDNAIKFTPTDGEVILGAKQQGEAVRLWVQDTGIGIAPQRLGEIFKPFHQLDGSSTRAYEGLGLGLALVKWIVEAHGAKVEVTSFPTQGSQFAFELPLAKIEA